MYNWGIIGTGWIAHEMGEAFLKLNKKIYGVVSGHYENALKYQEEFNVEKVYNTLDEMLEDDHIDAVYIATPHNYHHEQMIKALKAGKHVFVEKSITVNDQELNEAVEIAKKNNLVIMDGVTLFHMPVFKKTKEILESGKLGPIKMLQINFGSCKEYDVKNRFFSKELAGGALLDIGVYAVSFARYFMSSIPTKVLSTVNFFETGVDESSGIILQNDQELAVISLTMRAKQPKRGLIACEKGYVEIYNYPRGDKAVITYTADGHQEVIESGHTEEALMYEIKDMESYITNHYSETLSYTEDVMKILTEIRKQWGMIYPFEI